MLLPYYIKQVKHDSVQVYTERLYALANDVFTKGKQNKSFVI